MSLFSMSMYFLNTEIFLESEQISNFLIISEYLSLVMKLMSTYCRNRPEILMSGLHQPPRIPK